MKLQDLFNYQKEEFETNDSFAEHVLKTAKHVCPSLIINKNETHKIICSLAKFYKIEYSEVIEIIREIELRNPSKKYLLQYIQCLGQHYLNIEKR